VSLPNNKKLCTDAKSSEEAARKLLIALTSKILEARSADQWNVEYRLILEECFTQHAGQHMQPIECETKLSRTKKRLDTIGVSAKTSLHTALSSIAQMRGESVSEVARDLVEIGFEDFESLSFTQNRSRLLTNFEGKLANYPDGETTQWMVRVNRKLATRIKLSAREFGRSASQITAICIASALTKQSEVQPNASGAIRSQLDAAKEVIGKYKGPAARKLAEDIGLGKRGPLLIGVLTGKTIAPRTVLRSLALKLKVPIPVLSQVFNNSFLTNSIPAFKADNGKPQVRLEPQTWEDAVISLSLPDDETSALLEFAD